MTSPLGEHGLANEYLLTGYKPSPVIGYPSFGSILAKVRKQTGVLPAYVGVPGERSGGSGFLGAEFSPFMASGGVRGGQVFGSSDRYSRIGLSTLRSRIVSASSTCVLMCWFITNASIAALRAPPS